MTGVFHDLPRSYKAAVTVVFGWMLLLTVGLTLTLIKVVREQDSHYAEQRVTATQARVACERSRVFGPLFIDHIERVESKLHLDALERKINFQGKTLSALDYYRSTIPKSCPNP